MRAPETMETGEMTSQDPFRAEQRGVAFGMARAAGLALLVLAAAAYLGLKAPTPALAERVAATLRVDLLVVFWLAAAIANVARLRFFSPVDIAGSSGAQESEAVRRGRAVLQNTLEQAALALPVHLALAVLLESAVPVVTALALLFCLGRAAFWRGYAKGAPARAFGFALTFYPSLIGLLAAMVAALTTLQ